MDGVRAVAEEELGLDVVVGLAEHLLRPQLLEEAGDLQAAQHVVVSHADEAGVKALHAERAQHLLVGAVTHLGADHQWQYVLQGLADPVHHHDLALLLRQSAAEVVAKGAHTDH